MCAPFCSSYHMSSHSGTDDIQNVIQKTNKLIMRSQNQYMKKDFKTIIKKLDILIKKLDWLEWKELEYSFDDFRPHGQAVPLVWSIKSKSCLTKGFSPALWNIRPCARWPERQFWCRYGKRITQIVWWRSEQAWAFCNLYKHNYWHRQITFKFKTGTICSSLSGSIVHTHREFSNRCHLTKQKCFSFWSLN